MEQNTVMLCILEKTITRKNLKLCSKQMRTDQYCSAEKAEFLEISKLKRTSLQEDSKNEALSPRWLKRGSYAIEFKGISFNIRVPEKIRNQ